MIIEYIDKPVDILHNVLVLIFFINIPPFSYLKAQYSISYSETIFVNISRNFLSSSITSMRFNLLIYVFVHPLSVIRCLRFLNLVDKSHPALRSNSQYISVRKRLNGVDALF